MFYQNHAQSYQPNDIESQSGHPRPIAPTKQKGLGLVGSPQHKILALRRIVDGIKARSLRQ